MNLTTMLKRIPILLLLVLPLILVGCEGDTGATGPAGPQGEQGEQGEPGEPGNPGESAIPYTYVGGYGQECQHCHARTSNDVEATGHTHAYTNMDPVDQENAYCLQCHTTGWDREVTYSGEWAEANPDTFGYDDYYGVDGDEAAARRVMLEAVQCESCHGPMGPDFNQHRPEMSFATLVGPEYPEDVVSQCYPCHKGQFEGPSGEAEAGYLWSGHATVAEGDLEAFNSEHYAHIGSCNGCHTSEGFIRDTDPAFLDYEFDDTVNFIGCVTCHDPHAGDEGSGFEAQVRTTAAVEVAYSYPYAPGDAEVPKMEDKGTGQLCAQCHHGRRDTDNVHGQITDGYAHFGPHHSAQMDLYIGAGCYQIGDLTYEGDHTHQNIAKACVDCHMVRETEVHGSTEDYAYHNFKVDLGTNCTSCHPSIDEAYVTDYQAEIEDLMNDLATRMGYTDYHDMEENWDSTADGVLEWQREAAYAAYFIIGDGSMGVHNPTYAESILNNAIAHWDANLDK